MSLDEETNAKRERINAMKKKITINESDNDSITVTGAEKNKLKVNEQNGKKVKLSELNLLTPDEKRQLEEQSKKDDDNNTNDGKTGRVDIGKGDRAKADWKRDKLIEYTDIIDFLFKEIIVEGLDWSLNKAVNTVTFGTAWALDTTFKTAGYGKDRLWDAIKELRDKKNKQLDKTQNFSDRVLAMHSQKLPQQDQTALNDDNKKLIEGIAGIIRRGEYHNLNFMSPETQEIIKKTDPEKLNEILAPEKMKNLSAAVLYTVDMADMYSTNMATTRMLTAKAKDSNAYDGLDEQKVYDMLKLEARKEFSGLLNNAVANGQDITETAKNYFEMSLKANEHIKEEIQKGNYQEKGKPR